MAVARETLADDLSRCHIEGGEEGRRAMAFVVVSAALGLPRPHRQEGLGSVETLNLRLLVDTKDEGAVRRIEVQANNVSNLFDEQRIARQNEGVGPVRCQTECAPDPVHAGAADSGSTGHLAGAPVRRALRCFLESEGDDVLHDGVADRARHSGPGFVAQTIDSLSDEPSAPLADGCCRYAQFFSHRLIC